MNRAVERHFYESLLDVLKKEKEGTLQVLPKIACTGCGESILYTRKFTHLAFECTLGYFQDSEQKIEIKQCEVCNMSMPEKIMNSHKEESCTGKPYRVKRKFIKNSQKIKSKKLKNY